MAALLSNMIDGTKRTCLQFKDVRSFLGSILSEDTHAKRVDSLANAALGVMTGASLAVAMIGKSLAQARGLLTKHAVKQVDRLLSNLYSSTVPFRREKLPRLSVERSRVAEAPRGPEAVRPSRPRRQRGIGAQAKSQLCSRTSRHFAVLSSSVWIGRMPGSRLSPRSVQDRRMMGIRGIGLPMSSAPSRKAATLSAE